MGAELPSATFPTQEDLSANITGDGDDMLKDEREEEENEPELEFGFVELNTATLLQKAKVAKEIAAETGMRDVPLLSIRSLLSQPMPTPLSSSRVRHFACVAVYINSSPLD